MNNDNISRSKKLKSRHTAKRSRLRNLLGMTTIALGALTITPAKADFYIGDLSAAEETHHIRLCRASHFLSQASIGATEGQINTLANRMAAIGQIAACEEWIDNQFKAPTGTSLQIASQRAAATNQGKGNHWVYMGWMDNALSNKDYLRQRMAFALSQIFVVGDGYWQNLEHRSQRYTIHAWYYDRLEAVAFSNYRNVLSEITYNPFMGMWLTHNGNDKARYAANGTLISQPDQNFAREVMQLFSVGVYRQNAWGDYVTDNNGNPIENYTHDDVVTFSRVFTGLATNDGRNFNNKSSTLINKKPMKAYEANHDKGKKVLLGRTVAAGKTVKVDVNAALADLTNHPSTAPYFCQLLMKRFTSSNPSRNYVKRVTDAWYGKGTYGKGTTGDLKVVLKAILLDLEARQPVGFVRDGNFMRTVDRNLYGNNFGNGVAGRSVRGKIKDPQIRTTQFLRFMTAETKLAANDMMHHVIGAPHQKVLNSPTVFNFFSEAYAPSEGRIGNFVAAWKKNRKQDIELLSPEMQLESQTGAAEYERFRSLMRRETTNPNAKWYPRFPKATAYANKRFKTESELIRHLNVYLCGGTMSRSLRSSIIQNFNLNSNHSPTLRASLDSVLPAILTAPSYVHSH